MAVVEVGYTPVSPGKGGDMNDQMAITSAAAASMFATARQRRIVEALIAAPLTLSALARQVQLPLSLAHYHIGRLLALQLISIVREDRRAGRPVKHYRAVARSFLVPAELLDELPGAGLNQLMRSALDHHLARTVTGIAFSHNGQYPQMQLIRNDAEPASALELWLDTGLSRADADQLLIDLRAVIDHYRTRTNPAEPRHLLHVAAVKL
jgi:hypothetical protein